MYKVELLVKLKIPDVTALTAANTLRRRLGYADILERLDRADYYLFEVEAESEEQACAIVREIAERTTLFVNPNKHSFQVHLQAERQEIPRTNDAYEVRCLVRELDYDAALDILGQLSHTQWGEKIRGLQTGTLWILHLRASTAEAAKKVAEEIAVTRSRGQGLLVNPHYQSCIIS